MAEAARAPREVQTVAGRVPAYRLGATDAHDHLFLTTPAQPDDGFDDLDAALAEVGEGAESGLSAIVELTPIGLGRRPALLRAVSEATGVHVVAATGYHRDAHYRADHWVYAASVDELAEHAVADIEQGMVADDGGGGGPGAEWRGQRDAARAGVIKAGASYQRISPAEERRLRAAAGAARATGVAVFVHTEVGTCAPEIVDLLQGEGLAAERIVLAHLDRNMDLELHAELAGRGVALVYDTIGRIKYAPDGDRLALIEQMLAAGHAERLMLGLDLGRRSYLRAFGGGPGLRHLLCSFVPRLERRIGRAAVEQMLVTNPARVLALAR
ncbi:MAG: aryldialkylphosphatase [Chloroflexota bacterium]|nr:aryldialkylphosphatase [Chloroflexota bacterium]